MDNQETLIKYHKQLKQLFSSEAGKEVLDTWEAIYVDGRALDSTPELTYYRLGQKELIQSIIKDTKTDIEEFKDLVKGG